MDIMHAFVLEEQVYRGTIRNGFSRALVFIVTPDTIV